MMQHGIHRVQRKMFHVKSLVVALCHIIVKPTGGKLNPLEFFVAFSGKFNVYLETYSEEAPKKLISSPKS